MLNCWRTLTHECDQLQRRPADSLGNAWPKLLHPEDEDAIEDTVFDITSQIVRDDVITKWIAEATGATLCTIKVQPRVFYDVLYSLASADNDSFTCPYHTVQTCSVCRVRLWQEVVIMGLVFTVVAFFLSVMGLSFLNGLLIPFFGIYVFVGLQSFCKPARTAIRCSRQRVCKRWGATSTASRSRPRRQFGHPCPFSAQLVSWAMSVNEQSVQGGIAQERPSRAIVELLRRRASVQAMRVSARSSERNASLHRASRLQTVLSADSSTGSASRHLLASKQRPSLTTLRLMSTVKVHAAAARSCDQVEVLARNHRGGSELHDVGGGIGRGAVPETEAVEVQQEEFVFVPWVSAMDASMRHTSGGRMLFRRLLLPRTSSLLCLAPSHRNGVSRSSSSHTGLNSSPCVRGSLAHGSRSSA